MLRVLVVFICTLITTVAFAADPPPGKLAIKIDIDHPASAPLLLDKPAHLVYQPPRPRVGNEPPAGEIAKLSEGDNLVDVSTFPDGKHFFYIRREGCASQWIHLTVTNGDVKADRTNITLYHTRYVILKYAWNKN